MPEVYRYILTLVHLCRTAELWIAASHRTTNQNELQFYVLYSIFTVQWLCECSDLLRENSVLYAHFHIENWNCVTIMEIKTKYYFKKKIGVSKRYFFIQVLIILCVFCSVHVFCWNAQELRNYIPNAFMDFYSSFPCCLSPYSSLPVFLFPLSVFNVPNSLQGQS